MRILDRHILKETALISIAATSAFIFVMVAQNLLRQVVSAIAAGRVSGAQGLELMVLLIPGVLPYALPMGLLTGTLIAFGRMSAQQEITAMKASGLSLTRIARPALCLAIGLAFLSAWINLEVAPWANTVYRRMLVGSLKDNPTAIIVPGELNRQFKGIVIKTGEREGDSLKDFWLWRVDERGKLIQSIHAKEAHFERVDKPNGEIFLRVNLTEARMESRPSEKDSYAKPASFAAAVNTSMEFPATEILKDSSNYVRKLRWLTTSELWEAMDKGWNVTAQSTPDEIAQSKMEARKQFSAHLASAFSIFSLSLLAIPLAMRVGRAETFVNATLALVISLLYYVLTSAAAWVKEPLLRPDLLVWIPNLIVVGLALHFLRRSERR